MARPKKTTTPASVLDELAALPEAEAAKVLAGMDPRELIAVAYDWQTHARPKQLPPGHPNHECPGCGQGRGDDGSWYVWLQNMGRGAGKTRVGAEQIKRWEAEGYRRFAFVAETAADARDVLVRGESGILSVYPPSEAPTYEPSKRRLTWPSGAEALLFSGEEPNQLRGPQHEKAWVDEVAKYRYAQETWDMLEFGLRLGDNPQMIVTTTPRPVQIIRDLIADPDCHVTTGSTYENQANVAPRWLERLRTKYEGTRLGRQELWAELLDEVPGAIVTLAMIGAARWTRIDREGKPIMPDLARVVVGCDPAATSGEDSDDTGIVIAGLGVDGDYYVLDDRSCHLSPDGWGRRVVEAYDYGDGTIGADLVVGEANNGGEMVGHVIRTVDRSVAYKSVHASRGKHVRFAPVGALYEQGRVHHVGTLAALEDQVCGFTVSGYDGAASPDRADALVWALTELMEGDDQDYGLELPSQATQTSKWRR